MDRRTFLRTSLLVGAQALVGSRVGWGALSAVARRGAPSSDLVRGTTVIDMLGLLTLDWPKLDSWQRDPARLDQTELARLRDSGVRVFHPAVDLDDAEPHAAALRCMAGWNRLLSAHPNDLLRVDDLACLLRLRDEPKLGLLLGFQNSDHFRTVDDVAVFHRLGQRVSQLTYNERNRIGSGCTDPGAGGLSPFGLAVVRTMNRVGMAVDLSHCGERTTREAIDASARPVIITHSNCRALVDHPRCKSDASIRALATRGGVMGITMLPILVSGRRPATLEAVLDHFDHVANLVGTRHIGLGSDCDVDSIDPRTRRVRPAYAVRGLAGPRRVFAVAEGLLDRGYAPSEVQAISVCSERSGRPRMPRPDESSLRPALLTEPLGRAVPSPR